MTTKTTGEPSSASAKRALVLLTSLALLAAGCFGGDGDNTQTVTEEPDGPAEIAMVDDGFHQVEPGETLGGIVDGICGTNEVDLLWHVVDVNSSNQQPDGNYLTHIDQIEVGWFLEVPCKVPELPLIECPTSATTGFLGTDSRVRVALCNTDGRTEYFGQRLSDMDSIILDACQRADGTIEAVNQTDTRDFYYLVDPARSVLEIRRGATGAAAADAEVIATNQLELIQASTGGYRSCASPEPEPIEDEEVYQLDRAPLTAVDFDTAKALPEHTECDEIAIGMSAQASVWRPSSEADLTQWIEVDQGNWLRIYGVDVPGTVVLEGGGLSWPMEFVDYDNSYQLQITDEQPLGRYRVAGSSGDPAAKVEVKRAEALNVVVDHEASNDRFYLYRIYGAPASIDITLEVAQRLGCDGTRWRTHQNVDVAGRSNSGVIKLSLDMAAAPLGEQFCLAIDGFCRNTIFPPEG